MAHKRTHSTDDEQEPKTDLEVQADELGEGPGHAEHRSGGRTGGSLGLFAICEGATKGSIEESADTIQASEAAFVEGLDDAADHPERPAHLYEEYGRPDDALPRNQMPRENYVPRSAQSAAIIFRRSFILA